MPEKKSLDPNNTRVVHCFRPLFGGLFRHVCDLAECQSKRGLDVGIICDSSDCEDYARRRLGEIDALCSLGIHRIPMHRTLSPFDLVSLRKVYKICKSLAPNIIHGHGAKGGAYGRLVARKLGIKGVYTPHGGSLHYQPNSVAGLVYLSIERHLKSATDGIIFESGFSEKTYQQKIGPIHGISRVIYNGLYDDEFVSIERDKPSNRFVFVGELRGLKGLDVLLRAVSKIANSKDARTLIFGAGPDAEKIKKRIEQSRLKDTIEMLPPVFPSTQVFSRARAIVVPSLAESLPYIVLEAAAAKVPLLATKVGGIPEIFGPLADRLLPPNNPDSLAKAMQRIVADPKEAEVAAEILYRHVKSNFSIESMVENTLEMYRQVLIKNDH